MSKKLLVLVFLCFFVFSLGAAAKEEVKKGIPICFVTHVYYLDWIAQYEPQNPYEPEYNINFDPFYSFDVPGNKDREVLFIDFRAPLLIYWGDHVSRQVNAVMYFNIISDAIPEDIAVWIGKGRSFNETNWAENSKKDGSYENMKWIISRDSRKSPQVVYKLTGGKVPDEIAIPLINKLMDTGFSVEISVTYRKLLGVESIRYNNLILLVTEASK